MSGCPKCGGQNGYRFELTETHVMHGDWHHEAIAGDSGLDVKRTMPQCLDCGHRFRWSTFEKELE